jgi:hypothetical protein
MKWLWFGLAAAVSGFGCWALYDVKRELAATTAEVRESNAIVKEKLPPILDNSKTATDSLVTLSNDVSALRNLLAPSGGENPTADTPVTLAKYADGVLGTIEKADVQIGSKGSAYRKSTEWVAGERKEAFWLSFRATSRREMLHKIGHTVFGNPWLVKTPDGKTQPLLEWLRKQQPELEADLPPAK